MKKLIKILAVLAALGVVLIVIGSVTLRIYLPPEKAKALVLEHLSKQLKREVALGSVSVGILSGLQMSDLKISESPNFSKGTFLSSEQFSLKVALSPLLFRKVIVRQIILKKPDVRVIRYADGKTFNFSDLTAATVPQTPSSQTQGVGAPAGAKESLPFLLLVSRAEIQKGALHFVDYSPAQQSFDVVPLNLKLKSVSLTAPFSVQVSMHLKSKGKDLGIDLAGLADLMGGTFKIATGSVALGSAKATLAGSLSQLKTSEPACKLRVETNNVPIRELLKYAPGAVPPGVVLDGAVRLSADVSGTESNVQFAAKCIGTDLLIAKDDEFVKPTGIPLEFSVIGSRPTPNQIILKNITVRLGANEMTGSGTYQTVGSGGLVNLVAKGTDWSIQDLAKVSPLLSPYHPTGVLSFGLHAAGPASAPQTSLQTSGNVAMVHIQQEFYEGQNLRLDWNLTDITPDLALVSGTASLKQGPGKILNVEKLASSSRVGKIALAPLETLAKLQAKGVLKQINLPSLQTIPFDSVVGDYLLKAGTMNIKTFNLNGKDLSIQNQGTVGLSGVQPINLNVVMKLAEGSVGGTLGSLIKDESGRPTLKFTATGSVANPNVKLDIHEVGQKALQQAGQEIMKNKDVQNAVDDLQKNLKGLFH